MGADINLVDGYIDAKAKKLHGANISFDISSVGASGNTIMAAVLAKGTTVINNAATEPEITNLVEFLIEMGAKIEGKGTKLIAIEGVDELNAVETKTIADRIEAGTLLIAAAMTKGNISLTNVDVGLLQAVLLKLESAGCRIEISDKKIELDASDLNIRPTNISTSIFPGFPTDMQAQGTTFMSLAE